MEIYSTHNKVKSVIAERFIRTFKNKIFKYMISISKDVYINKSDDTVNKYNNKYHRTSKMKPVAVKSSIYIDSSKEINDKDPKFKIGVLLEYQNIKAFSQKSMPFAIKKVKNTVPWTYVVGDLKSKEIFGTCKNCKNQIKKSLESKK